MNRKPLALVGSLVLALLLAGCGSSAADRGATSSGVAPTSLADGSPAAPTPEIRIWGAGGAATSTIYASLAQWSREWVSYADGSVALVRIVDVSDLRWSTASGQGPSASDIARANQTGASLYIGRLVTVERVRMLRGTWPAAGTTALYWRSGGQIGNDLTPSYDVEAGLAELRPGAIAVAWTWPGADLDEATDGVLWVNVNVLLPVDASGRIRTYNPDETITVDTIESYLPVP